MYLTNQLAIGVDGIVVDSVNKTKGKVSITTKRLNGAGMNIATDSNSKSAIFIDRKSFTPIVK